MGSEKEILLSEVCDELAEIIQQKEKYIEEYGLMIAQFTAALEEGETPKMALALAKEAVK